MKVTKAIITAAGLGTRFLPITKALPKEMMPIVNRPLIQYCVEEAIACGIELVVIVTAGGKGAIENYFDRSADLENHLRQKGDLAMAEQLRQISNRVDICYIRQKQQLGLGHAVLTAKNIIGQEPFLLFLPDDVFEFGESMTSRMLEIYQQYSNSVMAVQPVAIEDLSRYGVIEPEIIEDRIFRINRLVEKPSPREAPSNLAIMGRYCLTPEVFKALENTRPGRNNEIQLTDALQSLVHGRDLYAYQFEGERYDAGTPIGWLKTSIALALKDPEIGREFRNYLKGLVGKPEPVLV
jgi:UTP--glucose-1-phosphate uridylyltransferase